MVFTIQALVWLLFLVALLIVEAATMGLTTIWFAGGALVACILAVAGTSLLTQVIVFCAVSLLLLIFTRPLARRWMERGRTRTNAESLIGETGVVTERIDNLASTGQVQVHGQFWTARSADDQQKIEKDQKVLIEQISGVKLIVKEE